MATAKEGEEEEEEVEGSPALHLARGGGGAWRDRAAAGKLVIGTKAASVKQAASPIQRLLLLLLRLL